MENTSVSKQKRTRRMASTFPKDDAWLRQKYVVERLSLRAIGDEIGWDAHSIRRRLLELGLPMRSNGGQAPIDREWLMEQYWRRNRTLTDVAAEAGCALNYLRREMARLGVPRKPRSMTRDNTVARVRTRRARRPGNFSDRVRLAILRRDGRRCRRCGGDEELECHHIIPVRYGGNDAMDNGITLCGSCHWSLYRCELDHVDELLSLIKDQTG